MPRLADLCIEGKVRFLVGEIADGDEGNERWEEKEHVDRENGAGVQECPSDSHHRSEQKERRAECEQDESGRIRNEENRRYGESCRIQEI